MSLLERTRCCPDTDVWTSDGPKLCEKSALRVINARGRHRRPDVDDVAQAQTLSLRHRRSRLGVDAIAQTQTFSFERRRCCLGSDAFGRLTTLVPVPSAPELCRVEKAQASLLSSLCFYPKLLGLDLPSSSSLRKPHR